MTACARPSCRSFTHADSIVAPRYALVGYPDTVFVDATGRIVGTVQGPVTRGVLEGWLGKLTSR